MRLPLPAARIKDPVIKIFLRKTAIQYSTQSCQEFMPENLQFTEINVKGFVIRESKILFTSLRVIGLFLRSEAPGLVFSAASHSRKKSDGIFDSHFRKTPRPSYFSTFHVNNLMVRVVKGWQKRRAHDSEESQDIAGQAG
jgi:hypothetical protein